jgi:LAO/AO transport system kinase
MGSGIAGVWETVGSYREKLDASGEIAARRAEQARAWMWNEVHESLVSALRTHPEVKAMIGGLETKVAAGEITPTAAAQSLLQAFRRVSAEVAS